MADERAYGERLDELLVALESIPSSEHDNYLAQNCPDPELRREAMTLLAAEAQSEGYLERFTEELIPKRPKPLDLTGRTIGSWRMVRPLGRGGMGVVYEAERDDGTYKHRVALKLLTAALTGTEAYQRFLAERQILAELDHPAIARIVDGGVTEDGTPWFAMEYVEGMPIDEYCDQHELGIRERLELFLQVCDAVEHAHRRLVVHRDLKPANVLVAERATNNKQRTTIKLLDFGIAKLLDAEAAGAPATRTTLRMMTPEYASPEQVRGEAVTTASDVYQLGLLLFELLTGHRAYVLHHKSAGELERVICEQPPTRLSSAITREDSIVGAPPDRGPGHASGPISKGKNGAQPEEIGPEEPPTGTSKSTGCDVISALCHARRTTPAKLRRRLRGDLENIVSKALSKEPGRRYGSADRLAQDIRRHLTGQPVMARADTWAYRSRKFFQRHAIGAATTTVMIVLITSMTGLHLVQLRSAYEQAETERNIAQAEATKAQQMNQLLAGLFRSADPREARGTELTARELLDRGIEQVERELTGQPDVLAEMLQILGNTYSALGIYDSAGTLLTRALEMRRNRLGPEHLATADVLNDIGLMHYRQDDYGRAREALVAASAIIESAAGSDAPELVEVFVNLAPVYWKLGEFSNTAEILERALRIQQSVSGEYSAPVAPILRHMCVMRMTMGELEQAESRCAQALAVYERGPETDLPEVGIVLQTLAYARLFQGKPDGLEKLFRRDVELQRQTFGTRHPRVVLALGELGNFLYLTGRNEEALEALQQAIEAANGTIYPVSAPSLASLGDVHLAGGRLLEARDHYQRSVTARDSALGKRQSDNTLAYVLGQLGYIEIELGNEYAAAQHFERALNFWQHTPDTVDPFLAPSLPHLAHWLVEQRRCAEAMPLFDKVLQSGYARQPMAAELVDTLENLLSECQE